MKLSKLCVLTSNTNKACDVSRTITTGLFPTIIYRANSPTMYARVMNLNFITSICRQNLRWGLLDILNHEKHQAKMDMNERKTLKHNPTPDKRGEKNHQILQQKM